MKMILLLTAAVLLDLLIAVFHGDILGPLNGGQGFLGKLVHVHMQKPPLLRFRCSH